MELWWCRKARGWRLQDPELGASQPCVPGVPSGAVGRGHADGIAQLGGTGQEGRPGSFRTNEPVRVWVGGDAQVGLLEIENL